MRIIDFIGDVHGHAKALADLLSELGYFEHGCGFRHPDPSRQAVFLGDYIDRGPQQHLTLSIVRAMRDAGDAICLMGNHEFNALAYATADGRGGYLRPHNAANDRQHAAFLSELPFGSSWHRDMIAFFKSLPVIYDDGAARAVHAAWIDPAIAQVAPALNGKFALQEERLSEALTFGTELNAALETILKGPEQSMPEYLAWTDSHGIRRTRNRIRWWNATPSTLAEAIVLENNQAEDPSVLPLVPRFQRSEMRPVFFGHYQMRNTPQLITNQATCLDFAVCSKGHLTAYTFTGEAALEPTKLTAVASWC